MSKICSYLNPCSVDFHAVENFKSLPCRQKVWIGLIIGLTTSTLILTPLAIPVFRLLVERCTAIHPVFHPVPIEEPSRSSTPDFRLDEAGVSCYVNYERRKKIGSTKEKKLLQAILSCRATKELYQKAVATNSEAGIPWIFEFAQIRIVEAECHLSERRIVLRSDLPFERALTQAVFELINAINAPAHEKLEANMGAYSFEEFIKAIEYVEWKGLIQHHQIIQLCIENHGWSETLDIGKDLASMSFKDYWDCVKKSPHFTKYEERYQKYHAQKRRERQPLQQTPCIS